MEQTSCCAICGRAVSTAKQPRNLGGRMLCADCDATVRRAEAGAQAGNGKQPAPAAVGHKQSVIFPTSIPTAAKGNVGDGSTGEPATTSGRSTMPGGSVGGRAGTETLEPQVRTVTKLRRFTKASLLVAVLMLPLFALCGWLAWHWVSAPEGNWSAIKTAFRQKHYGAAMAELRKPAAAGNVDAIYDIGALYDGGNGVPRDYSKAMKWWRKAASAGDGLAMVGIGYLYMGHGVPQDFTKAMKWFRRAEASSDPSARRAARRLAPKLRAAEAKH